jgi:glycosyltransferase involved in cell wall biosynthesis
MLVSVIIPCFNAEAYIRECIASVLQQSFDDMEIICVDNGSSDKTLQVLNEFSVQYPGKVHILTESVKGASPARNKGLSAAKGKWIQFLDADDILLPQKISGQAALAEGTGADLVAGDYFRENDGSRTSVMCEHDAWTGLIRGRLGITSSNLWKKEKVIAAGGWDNVQSSQETNLLFKMLKLNANVIFDDRLATVIKNRNSRSISNAHRKENWVRYIELRAAIWHHLSEKKMLTGEMLTALKKNIFDSIRILYAYDRVRAVDFHRQLVEGKFKPASDIEPRAMYRCLYAIFGFSFTQRIITLFFGNQDHL